VTDERALRRAILRAPDDDLPRLALADWYADQGRFKEEETLRWFLARPDYRQSVEVDHVIPWLPAADVARWKFSGEVCGVWHRGFGSEVRAPADVLFRDGPRLLAEQPVTAVRVTDRRVWVRDDAEDVRSRPSWFRFSTVADRPVHLRGRAEEPHLGDIPVWLFDELRWYVDGSTYHAGSGQATCPRDDPDCFYVQFRSSRAAYACLNAAALKALRKMADEYCVTVLGEEPIYGPSG
jgi:uncharacterized protein (TIGR02996 family)